MTSHFYNSWRIGALRPKVRFASVRKSQCRLDFALKMLLLDLSFTTMREIKHLLFPNNCWSVPKLRLILRLLLIQLVHALYIHKTSIRHGDFAGSRYCGVTIVFLAYSGTLWGYVWSWHDVNLKWFSNFIITIEFKSWCVQYHASI